MGGGRGDGCAPSPESPTNLITLPPTTTSSSCPPYPPPFSGQLLLATRLPSHPDVALPALILYQLKRKRAPLLFSMDCAISSHC